MLTRRVVTVRVATVHVRGVGYLLSPSARLLMIASCRQIVLCVRHGRGVRLFIPHIRKTTCIARDTCHDICAGPVRRRDDIVVSARYRRIGCAIAHTRRGRGQRVRHARVQRWVVSTESCRGGCTEHIDLRQEEIQPPSHIDRELIRDLFSLHF